MLHRFQQASSNPLGAIFAVANPDQPKHMHKYKQGYEKFFNELPILDPEDPLVTHKAKYSGDVLHQLALELSGDAWITEPVAPGEFERTILAIADKYIAYNKLHDGAEVIVAEWGKGYRSPVHGHAKGLLYEELIRGKFLVNTYRITNLEKRIVRIVNTQIYEGNTRVLNLYTPPDGEEDQSVYVHSFIALEDSKSLHFIPQHSLDGTTNAFTVEEFPIASFHVNRIPRSSISKGDVILSRCAAGKEYEDHYFHVTGDNGEHTCFSAGKNASEILNQYEGGDIYLRLTTYKTERFLEFHGITHKTYVCADPACIMEVEEEKSEAMREVFA